MIRLFGGLELRWEIIKEPVVYTLAFSPLMNTEVVCISGNNVVQPAF